METSKKVASRLTDIPDHILEEILLRLSTAADLTRASAACVSFRRLATDRSFLRQFRRIHSPPFIGFLNRDGFHPTQPPHPFSPALNADFSFSFLPSYCRWAVLDIRDGPVLLHRLLEYREQLPVFRDLVVCDPLHRRYILIPPVPEDLAPSMPHPFPRPQCDPFLVPLGEEIRMAHCKIKLSAFIFSSSTRQWTAAASKAWGDLVCGKGELDIMSRMHAFFLRRHYAYGCFYWDWLLIESKKLLMLDTRKMGFSMADLPPGEWSRKGLAFVEVGEGMPGMFGFRDRTASDLSYAIARNKGGESPTQWQMEKTISLYSGYNYFIKDASERYLLLRRTDASYSRNSLTEHFSMDIKTLKLQRVCAKEGMDRIYTNYPPSLLSSPTI